MNFKRSVSKVVRLHKGFVKFWLNNDISFFIFGMLDDHFHHFANTVNFLVCVFGCELGILDEVFWVWSLLHEPVIQVPLCNSRVVDCAVDDSIVSEHLLHRKVLQILVGESSQEQVIFGYSSLTTLLSNSLSYYSRCSYLPKRVAFF